MSLHHVLHAYTPDPNAITRTFRPIPVKENDLILKIEEVSGWIFGVNFNNNTKVLGFGGYLGPFFIYF